VTLVALIGRQLFGRQVGLLAALLTIASPLVTERMIWPMTEALAVSLSLLATWLVMRNVDRPTVGWLALAGVVLGLAYLTRPTVLALIGALGLTVLVLAATVVLPSCRSWPSRAAWPCRSSRSRSIASSPEAPSSTRQTYLYALYKDPRSWSTASRGRCPRPGSSSPTIWTGRPHHRRDVLVVLLLAVR